MPSELRKALTSSGDGAALNADDLDAVLYEELLKLQPLAMLLDVRQAEGKTHEYNVRTSHPKGWFEGEGTPANPKNGVYARKTVQLKIQRIWGSVTGFARAVDAAFIDALAEEIQGSLEGMAELMEYSILWGAADDIGFTGDAYQYSGIIPRMFSLAPENVIDAGGNKIELADLDAAIAKVAKFRQTRVDQRLWLMGINMKQVVDGLQTKVQLPLTTVELADGKIEMSAYGRAPIYETDFVVPEGTTTSPTVTATAAAGGSLADDEYFYRISSVTMYGEQVAGVEDSATTATTNNSVDLTWSADANAYLYMIWRGLATGAGINTLLDIIPAKTYDANGTVNGTVTTYSDEGTRTAKGVKPLQSGEQNIALVNINPARGASFVGLVDDMGRPVDSLLSFVELGRVKDAYDYFLKSYQALKLVYPNLVSVVRHAKLA